MRVVELSGCLCNMGEPLESLRQEKCGSRRASCRASVSLATITAPFEFRAWGHKRTVFTDVGHDHPSAQWRCSRWDKEHASRAAAAARCRK